MPGWSGLELVHTLDSFPCIWEQQIGEQYPAFKQLCLDPCQPLPRSYPCPRNCGCWHRIILRHDGSAAVASCECEPPACPDLELTLDQITCLQLNLGRLGRALCRALQLDSKPSTLGLPYTAQIGSWSAASVPAILTIQSVTLQFQHVVAELVAQLMQPFILLSPTARHLNAHCQSLLTRVRAGFFPLETTVAVNPDATLHPTRPPSDLFAMFNPPGPPTSQIHQSKNPTIHSPHSAPCTPKYALRKGLGCWHLTFDGQEAVLKHERGLFYVAWLLYHPEDTPIHALDLMAKIPEIYRHQLGLTPLVDPTTGKVAPLLSGARIQERSLALDDVQAMRALYKKQKELEAILDSDDATEPEKAEALRDLEAIYNFQKKNASRSKDAAHLCARNVRQAIARFHRHLATPLTPEASPHQLLRSFRQHLESHLIAPSVRLSGHGGPHATSARPGCFTYDPPEGTPWTT